MTDIATNLSTIDGSLSDIKTAIVNKGVTPSGNITTYATAIGQISGGGGSIPAERTVKANYWVDTSGVVHNLEDTSSTTLSANATSLTANLMQKYQNDTTIEKVDLSAITSIGSSYGLLYMTFKGCTNIVSVDLSALTVSGSGMSNTFEGCTGLTNIDLSALANIDTTMGLYATCKGCIALTVVRFPMLANIAASGMIYMFDSCTGLTDVYFNALTSSSFGANTNQFNKMLNNTTGVTVHFPSNLQAVIGSWSDVTAGFGGTNTTVLFDLTATS